MASTVVRASKKEIWMNPESSIARAAMRMVVIAEKPFADKVFLSRRKLESEGWIFHPSQLIKILECTSKKPVDFHAACLHRFMMSRFGKETQIGLRGYHITEFNNVTYSQFRKHLRTNATTGLIERATEALEKEIERLGFGQKSK